MFSKEVSPRHANGLLIAVGITIILFLVFASKSLDTPVQQDFTLGSSSSPIVEDWKGNSGSIPYQKISE